MQAIAAVIGLDPDVNRGWVLDNSTEGSFEFLLSEKPQACEAPAPMQQGTPNLTHHQNPSHGIGDCCSNRYRCHKLSPAA